MVSYLTQLGLVRTSFANEFLKIHPGVDQFTTTLSLKKEIRYLTLAVVLVVIFKSGTGVVQT